MEVPTNAAVIKTFCNLIFGKGIALKGQDEVYSDLVDVFGKYDQRCVIDDMKTFGMFAIKLVRSKDKGIAKMKHFPIDKLAMEKANEKR